MPASCWKTIACAVCSITATAAQSTVLYDAEFETSQGYDGTKDLAGQRGWIADGTGGNGLINGQFIGFGQQAYLGFSAPTDTNFLTAIWQPVGFDPGPAGNPLVHFSVKFQVLPSKTGSQDDFRWSIYNIEGNRLFTLSFQSATGEIDYILDDGTQAPSGSSIQFDGFYDVDIWMDFHRNVWTAFLNDVLLVNSEPITQKNAALTFGDADAEWLVRAAQPNGAGDNFMAFDNYRITSEGQAGIPGYVVPKGITNGVFNFTAYGEKGARYSVDVTTNFTSWVSLGEYDNPQGAFDFQDTTAPGVPHSFYRLRPVP